MRTIPLLLLLPLLSSSSRWSRSFPRRTQAWRAPGSWWPDTDYFDKKRNAVIPRSPAPPLKCVLLSAKHPQNQEHYPTIPGYNSQEVKNLSRLLLQKRKLCFPRSFPQRIDNLPGWILWTVHHAKYFWKRRSRPGSARLFNRTD